MRLSPVPAAPAPVDVERVVACVRGLGLRFFLDDEGDLGIPWRYVTVHVIFQDTRAIQALNRGGEMFLILPQSVINPMRPALSKVLTGDTAARDPKWTQQIAAEVQKAEVTLRAVLEERLLTLGEIADLKVGQIIGLDATPDSSAARATAGAITWISRGSNGRGIRYSAPNFGTSPA